jgi:hypothetical protein
VRYIQIQEATMRIVVLFTAVFCLCAVSVFAQETSQIDLSDPSLRSTSLPLRDSFNRGLRRKTLFSRSASAIDRAVLCSTVWQLDDDVGPRMMLVFFSDGVFGLGTYQASMAMSGAYRVVGENTVELTGFKNWVRGQELLPPFRGEEAEAVFSDDSPDFFSSHELRIRGTDYAFYPRGANRPDGHVGLLDGVQSVRMSGPHVVLRDVKFREGPATDAPSIKHGYLGFELGFGAIDYFLAGMKLSVLARTTDTYKIGEWESHWYYISYYDFETPVYGWVYGEFLDRYEESKKQEYKRWFGQAVAKVKAPGR